MRDSSLAGRAQLPDLPTEGRPEDRWIGLRRPARQPRMRLIALPYAGGSASIYRQWLTDLSHGEWLDFVAVQLPGHGMRIGEPLHTELGPLLDALDGALSPLLDLPYILLGYSMGALLAYELGLQFSTLRTPPHHVVLAARVPPYRMGATGQRVPPTSDEVRARIARLGGSIPAALEGNLLEEYLLPALQADFALVDYFRRAIPQILPCPVLALGATDDPEVSVAHTEAWGIAAGRGFEARFFQGGHFFLHTSHDDVIRVINDVLDNYRQMEPAAAGVAEPTPHSGD